MALILDGNGLIQGLSAGGLPDGSVNASSLASTLDLSSKTMTFGNVTASGITFPASQSASGNPNTLDDYEEGTWTPTFARTGSSYTFGDNSSGYRTGKYVKIGNSVYLWFSLSINSIGTQGSSYNQITGFPFASGGGGFARYGGSVNVSECLTSATGMYMGGSSETAAYLANQSGALATNFTTGAVFGFLSYQVS